eukprot:9476067-Pyramimonas_sp.AAC.1
MCGAIYVAHSLYVLQYTWCNVCGASCFVHLTWCDASGALGAPYVVQFMWSDVCGAICVAHYECSLRGAT